MKLIEHIDEANSAPLDRVIPGEDQLEALHATDDDNESAGEAEDSTEASYKADNKTAHQAESRFGGQSDDRIKGTCVHGEVVPSSLFLPDSSCFCEVMTMNVFMGADLR